MFPKLSFGGCQPAKGCWSSPSLMEKPVEAQRGSETCPDRSRVRTRPRSPDIWPRAGPTVPGCSHRSARCGFKDKCSVGLPPATSLPHPSASPVAYTSPCLLLHSSPAPPPLLPLRVPLLLHRQRERWGRGKRGRGGWQPPRHAPHTPHTAHLHSQPQPLTAGPASVKAASLP